MIIILGSGVSGLLLAQRLRMLKKDFLMLDKGSGPSQSGSNLGFFYSHEPNPFTDPVPKKVNITSCKVGSIEGYARKVYGDSSIPVSYVPSTAYNVLEAQGWALDSRKLSECVIGHFRENSEVYRISLYDRSIYTLDGRCWKFDILLNTIPLPILNRLTDSFQERNSLFHSRPIIIVHNLTMALPCNDGAKKKLDVDIIAHYCAADCHPWYRASCTIKDSEEPVHSTRLEYVNLLPIPYGALRISPGKIWFTSEEEKEKVKRIKDYYESEDVYCFGRYAEWVPKRLTHEVWNNSESLEKILG